MVELDSMAGDVRDGCCRLDDSVTEEVQTQLGILAFPAKQRVVDRMGSSRPRLCVDSAATGAGNLEYKRGCQDSRCIRFGFTFILSAALAR